VRVNDLCGVLEGEVEFDIVDVEDGEGEVVDVGVREGVGVRVAVRVGECVGLLVDVADEVGEGLALKNPQASRRIVDMLLGKGYPLEKIVIALDLERSIPTMVRKPFSKP